MYDKLGFLIEETTKTALAAGGEIGATVAPLELPGPGFRGLFLRVLIECSVPANKFDLALYLFDENGNGDTNRYTLGMPALELNADGSREYFVPVPRVSGKSQIRFSVNAGSDAVAANWTASVEYALSKP